MALTYHRAKGEAQRTKFIGRERGYHGVGFGGISVGGIGNNRKHFSANIIPGVDHLPHTLSIEHAAFSRGQPSGRTSGRCWKTSLRCTTPPPSRV